MFLVSLKITLDTHSKIACQIIVDENHIWQQYTKAIQQFRTLATQLVQGPAQDWVRKQ